MAALLARKETRESLRESSSKTLDYLNQKGNKLRARPPKDSSKKERNL